MFKIRPSAISLIMTEPKTKAAKEAGELSQTAKTYCENWLKEKLYNRSKEFTSKYTDKGIEVECDAIGFIAEQLNLGLVFKNEERFENEFMAGTPDLILADCVIDNKSSWDCFTFPLFAEKPDKAYWWQLQGYMALTGKDNAKLIYTLMNTPEWIIDNEVEKELRMNGVDLNEVTMEVRQEMSARYRYDDLKPSLRLKMYDFSRDNDAVEQIHQQVIKCRKYIEFLTNQIK
ncbi:MAG: hypothetical protein PHS05_02235 [Bacteroidales bacterium]|nr:hypothetical protein [Bacteroidales bacterium]